MSTYNLIYVPSYGWPRYFGRKHLGGIQGAAFTITIVGAAIGPMPFGIAYDLLGGYREAVLWLSLLPVIFGLTVMITRPPIRPAAREKQDQNQPL